MIFKTLILTLFLYTTGYVLPDEGEYLKTVYDEAGLNKCIEYKVFKLAIDGSKKIKDNKKKNIITIIDFSKPSTSERLFVIDLEKKQLVMKSLVAHGKNTGENQALKFSNKTGSLQSCLGFFVTGEIYYGKHGYSLRLDGLEKGINDNSRNREIVMHGADYVSETFARQHGRIGRSWGCPAVPVELTKKIIDYIADGSCLFIYANDKSYFEKSGFVKGL